MTLSIAFAVTDNQDQQPTSKDKSKGKQRRTPEKQTRKGISVNLTYGEWYFFKAASAQLGKTLAFMMREYTIEAIERDTNLQFKDYKNLEAPPDDP